MSFHYDRDAFQMDPNADWQQFSKYTSDLEQGGLIERQPQEGKVPMNPDGTIDMDKLLANISNQSFENMGMSPTGGIAYFLADAMRSGEMRAVAGSGPQGKFGEAESHAWEAKVAQDKAHFEMSQDQQQRWQADKDFDQKQWEEKQRLERERIEQERLAEEKWLEEHKGVDPEAENNRIMMAPLNFIMLGLGIGAIGTAGSMMADKTSNLQNPTLVATNTHGSMLAAALTASGNTIDGGTHAIVTGPGQAQLFTPGTSPTPTADPFMKPGTDPTLMAAANNTPLPGMTMKPSGPA